MERCSRLVPIRCPPPHEPQSEGETFCNFLHGGELLPTSEIGKDQPNMRRRSDTG